MSKKMMLLVLGAISAVMLVVPAFASALVPLHLNPTPKGLQTIEDVGANPTLTTSGSTIECDSFHGTAEFEAGGTTGKMNLTFGPNCKDKGTGVACTSTGETSGNIATASLPFHLVTLPPAKEGEANVPGVLVTPGPGEVFAHFTCGSLIKITVEVKGNGVIGTITSPKCGGISNDATIDFNATAAGVQQHTKVVGTDTIYQLKKNGTENAAQDATGTLTLAEGGKAVNSELVCT